MYARFTNNIIWAADLPEMGSLSSKNRDVKYLLLVMDAFTKYAFVKSLKNIKTQIILHSFIEIANESKCKTNKLWIGPGKELDNNGMQQWLDDNDILMYLSHNEDESIFSERCVRILKVETN